MSRPFIGLRAALGVKVPLKYGTMLRYTKANDPAAAPAWVFMFVTLDKTGYDDEEWIRAAVVKCPSDDDFMKPGDVMLFGIGELEPI